MLQAVLGTLDSYAVVLNPQRQILAANPALLQALPGSDALGCQGSRLGEALGCVHASKGPDGCGSSRACTRCGALLAMLACQETRQTTTGECLMSTQREGRWQAMEYAVRAHPITVADHSLTLLTLQDISSKKRREALEKIFIHDLRDSLQGLQGSTMMLQAAGADAPMVAERILNLTSRLSATVECQARLMLAESGELVPDLHSVSPDRVLDELFHALSADQGARLVRISSASGGSLIRTDSEILCRVLSKMALNALEALPLGGQARIWHERRAGRAAFVVQNPGCMPPEVADRVFQRSFSTKAGPGRGLGTYAMKLLGETILGGRVGFTTSWEDGTRFFIELPGDA
ncbi:MAG: HAMP domain-containing histidine kinase [Holophagaceae bacterium]|uniref:histidine kinase n=1 Tax=Candidatus Geothrix skivensis TaxID=2954439 RepID=A0A9D7SEB9_9BACT|nr:HAMP domain-containing histidine kinase [Candidatus Geothrix skivensis]